MSESEQSGEALKLSQKDKEERNTRRTGRHQELAEGRDHGVIVEAFGQQFIFCISSCRGMKKRAIRLAYSFQG